MKVRTSANRRFAGKSVSLRNLAFNADEVTIRQRSEGFGSPEEWLDKVDASVIFAFFDSYESAMENSKLPETQLFAAEYDSFVDGQITFTDLDVIDDRR